ncbi:DUF2142 domain-containing protein [Pseudarthrobacter sp. O4]|uniref:DUF2142 domain-containing protein n=1 Tax=Pseudarthrobacter sp. O4 TaxID=3418417 RepID=UPI003CFA68E7
MKSGKESRGLLRFLALFALVGLLTTLWSLASPLISVPDEQAHVIKAAAVVRGQLRGDSGVAQGERTQVLVPQYIASTDKLQTCYAGNALLTADCSPSLPSDTTIVRALTSAGSYNPMYYAVAGIPSLFMSGDEAVYTMRIVSGLFTAAFIAVALFSLSGLRRWRAPLFVGTFAITPMVLFLSGAVNPNSLEVATSMAMFCALSLTWERVESRASWKVPLALAAMSAVVLANTRAASLLWLALGVTASLLIFGYRPMVSVLRHRFVWAMAAVVALGCALSLIWLRYANSLQNLVGNGSEDPPVQIVAVMLDRTFDFATGYVSYLGWLDTLGPTGVLAVWAALIIGAVCAALSIGNRPGRLAVGFLLTAVVALPPILQIPLAKDVGIIWQGRYILALVVVLIAASGIAVRSFTVGQADSARRASAVLLTVMVFGHFYAFINGMRRYVIGLEDRSNWSDMVTAPRWEPPLGWITLTIAYLAVLLVAAVLLHHWVSRPAGMLPEESGVQPTARSVSPMRRLRTEKKNAERVKAPAADAQRPEA